MIQYKVKATASTVYSHNKQKSSSTNKNIKQLLIEFDQTIETIGMVSNQQQPILYIVQMIHTCNHICTLTHSLSHCPRPPPPPPCDC